MNKNEMLVKLRPISSSDYRFLFNLLKERDPKANISHRKIPTYTEHVKFVNSKPYSKWYIIEHNRMKAGSIYLTNNNEIGIFIRKDMQGNDIGKTALRLLMKKNPKKRYLANVSPKNCKSIKFFKKNRFRLIQYTYEFENTI
jgi:RimJ/RimL family protein N-acetyltransferase